MQWKQTFCAFGRICLDILFPAPCNAYVLEHISTDELFARALRAPYDHILRTLDAEAVFSYRDPLIRNSIRAFKYMGVRTLSIPFGHALFEMVCEDIAYDVLLRTTSPLLIIPIPLSKSRFRERTYNQSELIARAFASHCTVGSVSVDTGMLIRTRNTEKQALRSGRAEREENVRNCFAIPNPDLIAGKRVILIDDVITTGATMREARKTLLDAGAQSVRCLAVAH